MRKKSGGLSHVPWTTEPHVAGEVIGEMDRYNDMKEMMDCRTTRWRICGWSIWVVSASALGTTGCKTAPPAAAAPPIVQVLNIAATNAPLDTEIIGQLDSPQNVEVRARVEAFVEKVLFTEGE